jgi:hypothetical protein
LDDIEVNMYDNENNYLQYVYGGKLILMICNMYILKQKNIWLQEKNGLNFTKICTFQLLCTWGNNNTQQALGKWMVKLTLYTRQIKLVKDILYVPILKKEMLFMS